MTTIYEFNFRIEREAKELLDGIRYVIETYGSVTLTDIYDLSGRESRYRDSKIEWDTISDFKIVRVNNFGQIKWSIVTSKTEES